MQNKKRISSCTTILIGKNASYDGSTLMARAEDISEGFNPKKHIVIKPSSQPKKYKSKNSSLEIDLPDNPLQYTSKPDALEEQGIFGEAGINYLNIAMTATETITTNERILGADPFASNDIGEEDFLTIVLPYIKTAKEGVLRLGELIEKYGTYEANGIGFQDKNEIWYMETIGGHHFIAKRIPDDEYAVCPNWLNIDYFDFTDAFGEQKNHICSKDLIDFIQNNFLNLDFNTKKDLYKEKRFNTKLTFGSRTDKDKYYNSPRAWFMLKYFNPKYIKNNNLTPESNNLPCSLQPEKKITIEDIKYILSSHYQLTKYDPYVKYGDLAYKNKYRTIGYNQNCELTLTQIRNDLSDEIKAIEWIAFGPNHFNVFIPQYSRVNDTNKYLKELTNEVNTDNFYWINRIISALADRYYDETKFLIEKYQNLIDQKSHEFINKFDREFNNKKVDEKNLEEANDKIVEFVKKETNKLLRDILFISSLNMKNSFSRADI